MRKPIILFIYHDVSSDKVSGGSPKVEGPQNVYLTVYCTLARSHLLSVASSVFSLTLVWKVI